MRSLTINSMGLTSRCHPYVRVYSVMLIIIAGAFAPSVTILAVLFAAVAVFAMFSGVPLRRWALGIVPLLSLAASLFLLSLIAGMKPGDVDVERMAFFIARCYLAFLAASALLSTTTHTDVIQSLEVLRAPSLLTTMTGYILRWFHLLKLEAERMNTARLLRGGDRGSRLGQLRDLASLGAAMTIRSYIRAERVAQAMECRGFHGKLVRSIPRDLRLADMMPLAFIIVFIVAAWQVSI